MTKIRGFEVAKGFEDEDIHLPTRQTAHAAGYDFEAADDIIIPPLFAQYKEFVTPKLFGGEKPNISFKPTLVATGVKAYMPADEYLEIANRSSNPLKRFLILANGVGIVDADYYNNPANDGHIMFQFLNFSPEPIHIHKGDRIGQGIFVEYALADSDEATNTRDGGFGSTGH